MKTNENRPIRILPAAQLGIALGVTLLFSSPAMSAEETPSRMSRSVGSSLTAATDADLSSAKPSVETPLTVTGERAAPPALKRLSSTKKNATDAGALSHQDFWIYSTETSLIYDDDDDGHYHRFNVTFDPDVSYGHAHVYARLLLSFEGGPWNHLFTSDVFLINDTDPFDDYHIETSLDLGYPTGYYDVLIELYEADFDTKVAESGPVDSGALAELPLEDQERDPLITTGTHVTIDAHGGGSFGLAGLLLLAAGAASRKLHHA